MVYQSKFENHLSFKRPFRDPHHTSTINSIVGGGSPIKVGEISLSHNGILFMDEFAEFPTAVIQALREPMDSGFIRINRVNDSILVPAKFTLIATTNLCPCGYFDDDETICTCHPTKIRTYLSKFSGPILERIDISVKIKRSNTNSKKLKIDLNSLKKSITAAREIKEIEYDDIMNYKIGVDCLNQISKVYRPSHRKINKINTLVNTICKLAGEKTWREEYILEAIQYDELTSRIRSI
jgi:magnesium chelatase family protein